MEPFRAVGEALPPSLRLSAALEIHELLRGCEAQQAPSLDVVLYEQMRLACVRLGVEAGALRIAWSFEVDVPYVGSPDYAALGTSYSGPIRQAASLGLAGPLGAGLLQALADLGTAEVVGLGRLTFEGSARDAALARFAARPSRHGTARPRSPGTPTRASPRGSRLPFS